MTYYGMVGCTREFWALGHFGTYIDSGTYQDMQCLWDILGHTEECRKSWGMAGHAIPSGHTGDWDILRHSRTCQDTCCLKDILGAILGHLTYNWDIAGHSSMWCKYLNMWCLWDIMQCSYLGLQDVLRHGRTCSASGMYRRLRLTKLSQIRRTEGHVR